MQNKQGFWRGFTVKRMILAFLLIFSITLAGELLFDLSNWRHYLTTPDLLRRFFTALFAGFFISLWREPVPAVDKKTKA